MATQPVLNSNTLAWPNKHKRTVLYRGGALEMADGSQVTDLVNANAKNLFELSWTTLTSSELTTLLTAFGAVKNTTASYTDLDGTVYSTVSLDGMAELEIESVIVSQGIRYATSLKLREA